MWCTTKCPAGLAGLDRSSAFDGRSFGGPSAFPLRHAGAHRPLGEQVAQQRLGARGDPRGCDVTPPLRVVEAIVYRKVDECKVGGQQQGLVAHV